MGEGVKKVVDIIIYGIYNKYSETGNQGGIGYEKI